MEQIHELRNSYMIKKQTNESIKKIACFLC